LLKRPSCRRGLPERSAAIVTLALSLWRAWLALIFSLVGPQPIYSFPARVTLHQFRHPRLISKGSPWSAVCRPWRGHRVSSALRCSAEWRFIIMTLIHNSRLRVFLSSRRWAGRSAGRQQIIPGGLERGITVGRMMPVPLPEVPAERVRRWAGCCFPRVTLWVWRDDSRTAGVLYEWRRLRRSFPARCAAWRLGGPFALDDGHFCCWARLGTWSQYHCNTTQGKGVAIGGILCYRCPIPRSTGTHSHILSTALPRHSSIN